MSRPLLSVFFSLWITDLLESNGAVKASTHSKALWVGGSQGGRGPAEFVSPAAALLQRFPGKRGCSYPAIPTVDNKEVQVGFFTVIAHFWTNAIYFCMH